MGRAPRRVALTSEEQMSLQLMAAKMVKQGQVGLEHTSPGWWAGREEGLKTCR